VAAVPVRQVVLVAVVLEVLAAQEKTHRRSEVKPQRLPTTQVAAAVSRTLTVLAALAVLAVSAVEVTARSTVSVLRLRVRPTRVVVVVPTAEQAALALF
jgi:uncharacterized membrane protein